MRSRLQGASAGVGSDPLRFFGVGIDDLTRLVRKWLDEPSTYSPEEMRASLDSWREVLFSHLDQEVIYLRCGRIHIQARRTILIGMA